MINLFEKAEIFIIDFQKLCNLQNVHCSKLYFKNNCFIYRKILELFRDLSKCDDNFKEEKKSKIMRQVFQAERHNLEARTDNERYVMTASFYYSLA